MGGTRRERRAARRGVLRCRGAKAGPLGHIRSHTSPFIHLAHGPQPPHHGLPPSSRTAARPARTTSRPKNRPKNVFGGPPLRASDGGPGAPLAPGPQLLRGVRARPPRCAPRPRPARPPPRPPRPRPACASQPAAPAQASRSRGRCPAGEPAGGPAGRRPGRPGPPGGSRCRACRGIRVRRPTPAGLGAHGSVPEAGPGTSSSSPAGGLTGGGSRALPDAARQGTRSRPSRTSG